ncbi:PREDICTED: coiled-coil domain-containing glutamate-rich protein 1 [Chrysochloris asiatica]|uniref:Coiled-coil domain-containing glutamate-rich protein 1 n=1 Tax=Chrysochloris asiatica TaxID=185453 RepID=A0A9B0WUP0_CHRAS|nr:PREDICTED: coiled-coil domain-containing glutamate-rich protein 1 [Chrysochloris asiatica]
MAQTLQDPLNLGGGWASSAPVHSWSSNHRRRRGAPTYKRRYRYGPKAEDEPPRKQPKQQHGPRPWYQPPRRPYWAVYSNWRRWRGPWYPPPAGFWKVPRRVQLIWVYGLHPLCLCCCSCWHGSWNPGCTRPHGRKRRWGRRGRGLRRRPRRSSQRSPSGDLSMLLRPGNLYGWRAPGMRAPRNTTQFIMNQNYEDMRQQEKLERQQEALRAQQVQASDPTSPMAASGEDSPPSGYEEDAELQGIFYGLVQNPALVFSPASKEESLFPNPQQVEEDEKNGDEVEECEEEVCEEEVCDDNGFEQEDEEAESEDGEYEDDDGENEEDEAWDREEEEAEDGEEEEEEEEEKEEFEEEDIEEEEEEMDDQRVEENHLPLKMPLSILVGSKEENKNFMSCNYFSPKKIHSKVAQETLLVVQDIN